MLTFRYHPDILTRYPQLRAGIILAHEITNSPTPQTLKDIYLAEQRLVLERTSQMTLSEVEPLAAWRTAFRLFGVDPTQYRSAPEALMRRLTKKGDIPCINTLVDLCNLVSIRYFLPIAAFDVSQLQGAVTVHFSDGSERYTELGRQEIDHPIPGEVVFSDETGLVIARRWCWRQSDQSAANLDIHEAIITVEAQHAAGLMDVQTAMVDLMELLRQYVGGNYMSGLLDPSNPAISG